MNATDLGKLDRDALILKQAAIIKELHAEIEAPAAETLSDPPIDVPVADTECPQCGGELNEGRVEEASIVDPPEVVRPRVRLFRLGVRRCKRCKLKQTGRWAGNAAPARSPPTSRSGCGG